jgi:hypothetical protein
LFIVNILRKYFILEKYNKINIYLYKYLKWLNINWLLFYFLIF